MSNGQIPTMGVVRATQFSHTKWATWAGSWVTFCGLGRFKVDISRTVRSTDHYACPITPHAPPSPPEPYQSPLATSHVSRSTGQYVGSTTSPGRTSPGHACTPPWPPTPGLQPPGHIRPPPMLPRAIINALTNIQPLTVNWSVRHVPQIARGASPGHTCTPPRPTFLTQSSKATSKANWSTLLAYHADLGCPGLS